MTAPPPVEVRWGEEGRAVAEEGRAVAEEGRAVAEEGGGVICG